MQASQGRETSLSRAESLRGELLTGHVPGPSGIHRSRPFPTPLRRLKCAKAQARLMHLLGPATTGPPLLTSEDAVVNSTPDECDPCCVARDAR